MNKEELINLIAKENNILIGKDDPIIMLVTASDFLIKKFELSMSDILSESRANLELDLYKYNESVKKISEKTLNASLTASKKTLTTYTEASAAEIKEIIKSEILAAKIEIDNERKKISFYSKINLILLIFIIINIFFILFH
jgi:hypothetical protein